MEKKAADFIDFTKKHSTELGEKLETICLQDFVLADKHPLYQAGRNYQYLPDFNLLAKNHPWINLDYQMEFVKTIFSCWRHRLKNYKEFYKSTGFIFIFSEDFLASLTVTAVARTSEGNPYPYLEIVPDIRRVFEINKTRNFDDEGNYIIDPKEQRMVLDIIEQNEGSIGKPSANQLKLKVGELRKLILKLNIGDYVNSIRKKYKKGPADLYVQEETQMPPERVGWEGILPPGY